MALPKKYYLKLSDIENADLGINREQLRKAVQAGTVTPVHFPGGSINRYRRKEIVKAFGLADEKGTHDETDETGKT